MGIVTASAVDATTYYVSNNGNDANDGEDISRPWKTTEKVNAYTDFKAGDNICFRKNDHWTGNICPRSSGSSNASRITYTTYGTGLPPHFTGNPINILGEAGDWSAAGTGKWSRSITSLGYNGWNKRPNSVLKATLASDGSTVYLALDGSNGHNHTWSYNGNTSVLTVKTGDDTNKPATTYTSLVDMSSGIELNGKSYLTFDGFEISDYSHGLWVNAATTPNDYITISNCHIHNCYDTGIYISANGHHSAHANFANISNCIVHDIWAVGIIHDGGRHLTNGHGIKFGTEVETSKEHKYDSMTDMTISDTTVYNCGILSGLNPNNYQAANGIGIQISDGSARAVVKNCVVYNTVGGIRLGSTDTGTVTGCVVHDTQGSNGIWAETSSNGQTAYGYPIGWQAKNITFSYNEIYNVRDFADTSMGRRVAMGVNSNAAGDTGAVMNVTIFHNKIYNNSCWAALSISDGYIGNDHYNLDCYENRIYKNAQTGMVLHGKPSGIINIHNNIIYDNARVGNNSWNVCIAEASGVAFKNNILLSGDQKIVLYDVGLATVTYENNTYWSNGSLILQHGATKYNAAQINNGTWGAVTGDKGSVAADPKLQDPTGWGSLSSPKGLPLTWPIKSL